jgi:hypothetical protein
MRRLLFLALLILAFASVANAQNQPVLTPAQSNSLLPIKHTINGVYELAKDGTITQAQADQASKRFLSDASKIAGREVSLTEISALPDVFTPVQSGYVARVAARVWGWASFGNIMIAIAVIIGVVSVLLMFGHLIIDLLEIFAQVPIAFYESLFYILGAYITIKGRVWSTDLGHYFGLLGSLLLAGCVGFSLNYHSKKKDHPWVLFAIITPIFGLTAIYYQSVLIGVIASVSLICALGFAAGMGPMCYFIGFYNDDALARGTSASFLILALFVGLRATDTHIPNLEVFAPGMLFVGSFVGYLGLLIASSKWYDHRRSSFGGYLGRQLWTLVLCMAALFFGAVLNIPQLLQIGGTFFALWALEKGIEVIDEIRPETVYGWCTIGIILAIGLAQSGRYIINHQDFFAHYLLFM